MNIRSKIFLWTIIVSIIMILTSCSDESYEIYPKIIYHPNFWSQRTIYLEEGSELNDGHTYDIVETEQGYDLVLHFDKIK